MPDGTISERFGIVECRFACERSGLTTEYRQTGAAIALGARRIPLPPACRPRVTARETALDESRRRVDVRIAVPLIGTLLTYGGTIEIEEVTST